MTEIDGSSSPLAQALAAEEKRHEQREKKMVESPSSCRPSGTASVLLLLFSLVRSPMDATAARQLAQHGSFDKKSEQILAQSRAFAGSNRLRLWREQTDADAVVRRC